MDTQPHTMWTFRLMDLPLELRNEVYKHLLCSFEKRPSEPSLESLYEHPPVLFRRTDQIDTTILRTCKQIHREAYDVMVKTNQFIKVIHRGESPEKAFVAYHVPKVHTTFSPAIAFQGYLFSIFVTNKEGPIVESDDESEPEDGGDWEDWLSRMDITPEWTYMILGRDWPAYCNMLKRVGGYQRKYSDHVALHLDLDTWKDIPDYKNPLSDSFTRQTQAAFMDSFRGIRGFPDIHINGVKCEKLRDEVITEVSRPCFKDCEDVLQYFNNVDRVAKQYHDEGNLFLAMQQYRYAVDELRILRAGTSWASLVAEGGLSWHNEMAKCYTLKRYQYSCYALEWLQLPSTMASVQFETHCLSVSIYLSVVLDIPNLEFEPDFGGTWRCDDGLIARGHLRYAQCWRLISGVRNIVFEALRGIKVAQKLRASLSTQERTLLDEESRLIFEWKAREEREEQENDLMSTE